MVKRFALKLKHAYRSLVTTDASGYDRLSTYNGPGILGRVHEQTTLKSKGNNGSFNDFRKFLALYQREGSASVNRQYNDCCLYQFPGRCQQTFGWRGQKYMASLHNKCHTNTSTLPPWSDEPRSRQVKSTIEPLRVEATPTAFQIFRSAARSSYNKSVCLNVNQTMQTLQQFTPRPMDRLGGCTTPKQLGIRKQFCQPSFPTFKQNPQSYRGNRIQRNNNRTHVACPTMVPKSSPYGYASTTETPKNQAHLPSTTINKTRTNEECKVAHVCLESEWKKKKHLLSLSWSNESTSVYANCLAKSYRDQYNGYLTRFKEFCTDSYDSPFPPARDRLNPMIADFLCMKASESERPESVLRTSSSALSNYFLTIGHSSPITFEIQNLIKALIKFETKQPAGRTKVMPIASFMQLFSDHNWADNNNISIS